MLNNKFLMKEDKIDTSILIIKVCEELKELLLSKNKSYGDSALNSARIFSELDSCEGIKIRLDDKLMRIKNKGINNETIDTLMDIMGYLVLLKIAVLKNGTIKEWDLQNNRD